MNTAVIGLGNIGSRVATNLANGGVTILVAERQTATAQVFAERLGPAVRAAPIEDAVRQADTLILAIYFDAIKDFLAAHRSALVGKIVIDPSNPIAPDGKGGFRKTIPEDQSSGEIIAGLLPPGAKLVKAFGTLGAESLGTAASRTPERAVLFYATDHPDAGRVAARLITESGFAPVSVGGIAKAIRIEVGGDLHEFGKLGRLVSAQEAAALV